MMFRLASINSGPLRVLPAAIFFFASAVAYAVDDPPAAPPPDVAAAEAQRLGPPPIPYNSGTSPQLFQADRSKVTHEQLPNGMTAYHLNGQGMQSVFAHVEADGSISIKCKDRPDPPTRAAAPVDAGARADEH